MTTERRKGSEHSGTRLKLVEAAESLMLEEGYAAVTARRLAVKAGLKSQLLHYYFEDMDELFAAVIRRRGEVNLEKMVRELAAAHPLEVLWNFRNDPGNIRISNEFLALASHRPAVTAEVKRFAEQQRIVKAAAVSRYFETQEFAPPIPPTVIVMILTSLSTLLNSEAAQGISLGHAELQKWTKDWLGKLQKDIDPDSGHAADKALPVGSPETPRRG